MRILFYSDNLYPEISGISDSIITLGRELQRRGHAVAFAGPRYSRANYAYVGKTPDGPSPLDGFEVCRIPSLSFGAAASGVARFVFPFGYTLPFVRRFKPDVIHTQDPFGAGIEALMASRLCGVPLVGTNHTIIDQFIRIYGPIRTEWAVRWANRLFAFYYSRCKVVTAPVQTLLDDMKRSGLKAPSQALSNPIGLSLFGPATAEEKAALRAELGIAPAAKVFIFSGRIAAEKKIQLLIHALEILAARDHSVKLVIAGNGPVEAELRTYAEMRDVSSHIIFTGFLDHAALAKWYKASDAFATMSDVETQCLSLMQAFATGLPCVGANAGAVGMHIKPEFGFTVPEGDARAAAAAIERIFSAPEAAAAMGQKARAYVQAFSESAVADKWEKIYTEAIE